MGFTFTNGNGELTDNNKRRLKWLGMFLANSTLLSGAVGSLLWVGITTKLEAYGDERYAPKETAQQVSTNTNVLEEMNEKVDVLGGNIKSFQGLWMRKELFSLRVEQCESTSATRKRELGRQAQELARQYRLQIEEAPPPLVDCEDL